MFCMKCNIHTNFQGNIWKSFAVIAYTIIFEESKWRKVQSENVAMATIFVRIFRKLQKSYVGPLWRYCESIIRSYLHGFMCGTNIDRFALKLKKNVAMATIVATFPWKYI